MLLTKDPPPSSSPILSAGAEHNYQGYWTAKTKDWFNQPWLPHL